jgi:hypothetical protein
MYAQVPIKRTPWRYMEEVRLWLQGETRDFCTDLAVPYTIRELVLLLCLPDFWVLSSLWPIPVLLCPSRLPCSRGPILTFLSCPVSRVLAGLSWPSCPGSPVLEVLSWPSFPGFAVQECLSELSYTGYPFLAALFWLPYSCCPILAFLVSLYFS